MVKGIIYIYHNLFPEAGRFYTASVSQKGEQLFIRHVFNNVPRLKSQSVQASPVV